MPIIQALRKAGARELQIQGQFELHREFKFKARLGYIVRPCLKKERKERPVVWLKCIVPA
jgi:hypothetical protein